MVFGPPDPLGLHAEIVRALLGLARRAGCRDDELPLLLFARLPLSITSAPRLWSMVK
jgi:hypothetical protein